jgi:hypothetical protein
MKTCMHCLWIAILFYLIGVYFPGLGKMTVGKIIPAA